MVRAYEYDLAGSDPAVTVKSVYVRGLRNVAAAIEMLLIDCSQ